MAFVSGAGLDDAGAAAAGALALTLAVTVGVELGPSGVETGVVDATSGAGGRFRPAAAGIETLGLAPLAGFGRSNPIAGGCSAGSGRSSR